MIRLAFASLWNRRVTAGLTLLAIAFSVAMLLAVEKLRRDAREAFTNTISGTDLIVGARGGGLPLLLYSVFRIGNATNNITWKSYQDIAAHPNVRWTVPLSLGDSHRGYRVLGTSAGYFEHYRYAGDRGLELAAGEIFDDVFDVVLGAEVAAQLGYAPGQSVVVAHGTGSAAITEHDDKPFKVSGILAPTGTPVDRTLHVSLEGIEAMHADWFAGAPVPGVRVSPEQARQMDLRPKAITAFLVGLKSRIAIFSVQREVNQYREEPLTAIVPGVALQELWQITGAAETALRLISAMVVVTGLLGMVTVIFSSLETRRREMAVLRSLGARPLHVFVLFVSEAGVLTTLGAAAGVALMYGVTLALQPVAAEVMGLHLSPGWLERPDLAILGLVIGCGLVAGTLPAFRAYRMSLADGLSMRI